MHLHYRDASVKGCSHTIAIYYRKHKKLSVDKMRSIVKLCGWNTPLPLTVNVKTVCGYSFVEHFAL
jgi:hypothetical protein